MPATDVCGRADPADQARIVRAFADVLEVEVGALEAGPGDVVTITLEAGRALSISMAMRAVLAARGNS